MNKVAMRMRIPKPKTPVGWLGVSLLIILLVSLVSELFSDTFWHSQEEESAGTLPTSSLSQHTTPELQPSPAEDLSAPSRAALLVESPTRRSAPVFASPLAASGSSGQSQSQELTVTAAVALELTAEATPATETPTAAPPTATPTPEVPTALPTTVIPPTLIPALPDTDTPPDSNPPGSPPGQDTTPLPVPAISPTSVASPGTDQALNSPTETTAPTVPAYIPVANPLLPLPPPSLNDCMPDPHAGSVPNYPIRIYTIDKETEVFTLHNVSTDTVDLSGWVMCSIRGREKFDGMHVSLAPNERRSFVYPGAAIWNNTELDDGALYNAQGQLVSYWSDPGTPNM